MSNLDYSITLVMNITCFKDGSNLKNTLSVILSLAAKYGKLHMQNYVNVVNDVTAVNFHIILQLSIPCQTDGRQTFSRLIIIDRMDIWWTRREQIWSNSKHWPSS